MIALQTNSLECANPHCTNMEHIETLSVLAEIGANGFLIFLIHNLAQANTRLLNELSSRDEQLTRIIEILLSKDKQ